MNLFEALRSLTGDQGPMQMEGQLMPGMTPPPPQQMNEPPSPMPQVQMPPDFIVNPEPQQRPYGVLPPELQMAVDAGNRDQLRWAKERQEKPYGLLANAFDSPKNGRAFSRSLSAGFSGIEGNTKGGTFARGMGGAMRGGERFEDDEYTRSLNALDRAIKFKAAGRDDAYKAALTQYYQGKTRALTDPTLGPRGPLRGPAWQKPHEQRFLEAEKLINVQNRQIDLETGVNNPRLNPQQRAEAQAKAQKLKEENRARVFKEMGLDPKVQPQLTPSAPQQYPQGQNGNPFKPMNANDFKQIPPGAYYVDPGDGKTYVKRNPDVPGKDNDRILPPNVRPNAMEEDPEDQYLREQ
jgi:hypothetical protein